MLKQYRLSNMGMIILIKDKTPQYEEADFTHTEHSMIPEALTPMGFALQTGYQQFFGICTTIKLSKVSIKVFNCSTHIWYKVNSQIAFCKGFQLVF